MQKSSTPTPKVKIDLKMSMERLKAEKVPAATVTPAKNEDSSSDIESPPKQSEFMKFLAVDKSIKQKQIKRKNSYAMADEIAKANDEDSDISSCEEISKEANKKFEKFGFDKRQRKDSIKGNFLADNLF